MGVAFFLDIAQQPASAERETGGEFAQGKSQTDCGVGCMQWLEAHGTTLFLHEPQTAFNR
jgi:hypothetical protein